MWHSFKHLVGSHPFVYRESYHSPSSGADMAVDISDFNETDDFEDYNPHPYQGGYNIALTYGEPLHPSSAICYPVSGVASFPPLSPQTPLSLVPVEEPVASEPAPVSPESGERAISTSDGREDDLPESKLGSFNSYGERLYGLEDYWSRSFGFYPFANLENEIGGWKYDAEDLRYWSQLKRVADYLFGYSQGYGERRIGVDRDGIPIYANKTRSGGAVDVQIQPAITEKLGYYTNSLDSGSWYSGYDKEVENYEFNNSAQSNVHHFEQPIRDEADPAELVFSWQSNYPGFYDEQVNSDTKWCPLSFGESVDEVHLHTDHELSYDNHRYEGALHIQLEEAENSHQTVSYYEASQEISYSDPSWEPGYYIHGEETNQFRITKHDYDRRDYLKSSNVELEPYRSTWSRRPGYYGVSEGEVYAGSKPISNYSESYNEFTSPRTTQNVLSSGEWNDEGELFDCSNAMHQVLSVDNSPIIELEPFKPTWVQNPNYYKAYEDDGFSAD